MMFQRNKAKVDTSVSNTSMNSEDGELDTVDDVGKLLFNEIQ